MSAPSASALYEGLKAQRNELTSQLDELQSTRREITSQLEDIPAGDDGEFPPQRGGQVAGGLRHADHRDGRELAQREQARIAEAGDDHGVHALALARVGVEHGMAGDGRSGPRGDVARAEPAGRRHHLGLGARHAAGYAGAEFGQMRTGVRIDEEKAHVSSFQACACAHDHLRPPAS